MSIIFNSVFARFRCFQNGKTAFFITVVVLLSAYVGQVHGTDWAYETGDLRAVWGSAADDIFAVGKRGIILHYDGGSWTPMDAGTGNCSVGVKLQDVWGSSGTDVYAVGCYDSSGELFDYCDETGGMIFHYDGRVWKSATMEEAPPLVGVWGSSEVDVFAVGDDGTIMHYDGISWTPMESHTTEHLYAVWGTSGNDVFAVGYHKIILHYDGSEWSVMSSGTSGSFTDVWGTSGSNVYAVGGDVFRYDGNSWQPVPEANEDEPVIYIWGSSAADIFGIGNQGAIVHFNGNDWSLVPSDTTADLKGIWGSSGSNIFAVGDGSAIIRYNGSAWSIQSEASTQDLYDAWGTSENNVYAVGDNGAILHFNGAGWKSMVSNTSDSLRAVWGSSVNSAFAAGYEGTVVHYDGSSWNIIHSDPETHFYDIWGSSGSDVYVGGVGPAPEYVGRILHFDGSAWTTQDFEAYSTIEGIYGTASNDVFATTYYTQGGLDPTLAMGVSLHFDGNSWSATEIGENHRMNGIWASAADDVHAVGNIQYPLGLRGAEEFARYDGSTWRITPSDFPDVGIIDMYSVSGRSKNDLFAVGSIGSGGYAGYAILRNTGGLWWLDRYNSHWHPLYGVWASTGGHVFAVGRQGVILRLVPEEPPPAPGPLWARTYGGEGIDKVHAMAPTSDGGSIVAGQTGSIGAGGSDVWVVRLDEGGDTLWHKAFGGANDDQASAVVQTADGGYIVAGSTASFGAGASDAWIAKLDPQGNLEWENAYGGLDEDSASAILEVGSCAEGYAYAVLGTTRYGQLERDGWVMKLTTAGGVAWRKTYPMDGGGDLVSLARGNGTGYFVSGKTNHYYGGGFSDFLVLRLDDAGDVLWGKNFGLCSILTPQGCNINIEKPASLCVAEDGGPLLVGRSSPSHGSPFVWGVKLNALGGVEWQYTYYGDVAISSVRQTRDLGYIVGGRRKEYDLYSTREYTDGWLMKLDQDGASEWTGIYRGFDRTDQEAISSVHQSADSGYVASGWTTSLTPGEEDFWVLRLDESGLIPECAGMTTWHGGLWEETAEQGANISITAVETDTVVSPSNSIVTATEVITQDTCLSGVSDLIDLPRTGQTTAYHVGDDGHIRAGAPWPSPRFADNGDGTVTDDLTGLVWLKDANCLGTAYWGDAMDNVAGFNADPDAFGCAEYDSVNHTDDWRAPNINEIESLTNAQVGDNAAWLNGQGFIDVAANWYWSSSTPEDTSRRWTLNMKDGMPSRGYGPGNSFRMWPVRGGQKNYWNPNFPANVWKTGQTTSFHPGDDGDLQMGVFWPSQRFQDNEDGTVTDNLTGLVWLKDTYCFADTESLQINSWQDGLAAVADFNTNPENYSCAEYDLENHQEGWRVPNKKELLSLMDWSRRNPALPAGHPFLDIEYRVYWSSTTYPSDPSSPTAWVAYPSGSGGLFTFLKNHGQPTVWPVRGEIHGNVSRDADFDGDGDVDGHDVAILAAAFGSNWADENFDLRADMVSDGVIDQADLQAFVLHLGRTDCPCQ